jgi:hypothetical protein
MKSIEMGLVESALKARQPNLLQINRGRCLNQVHKVDIKNQEALWKIQKFL